MTLISNHVFSGSNETIHETRRVGGFAEKTGREAAGHDLLQTTRQVSVVSTQWLHLPTHAVSLEQKVISSEN